MKTEMALEEVPKPWPEGTVIPSEACEQDIRQAWKKVGICLHVYGRIHGLTPTQRRTLTPKLLSIELVAWTFGLALQDFLLAEGEMRRRPSLEPVLEVLRTQGLDAAAAEREARALETHLIVAARLRTETYPSKADLTRVLRQRRVDVRILQRFIFAAAGMAPDEIERLIRAHEWLGMLMDIEEEVRTFRRDERERTDNLLIQAVRIHGTGAPRWITGRLATISKRLRAATALCAPQHRRDIRRWISGYRKRHPPLIEANIRAALGMRPILRRPRPKPARAA